MKLSVSLPVEDVEFLDAYARDTGVGTRSAALHRAVRLLRGTELADSYRAAWEEWEEQGDSELWDAATADGITPR